MATAGKNLFTTIPIVLAGSMAVSLALTGPLEPIAPKKSEKSKASPGELVKSLRTVFTTTPANPVTTTPEATTPATLTLAEAPTTYRVVAGDTVSSIAAQYGLATASVLALNGLGWSSVIFPGQELTLAKSGPVAVVAPVADTSGVSKYTIQTGDTMGGIAAKFGLSTQVLLSANGLGWSSIIYPGQSIVIPSGASSSGTTATIDATAVSDVTPIAGTTYTIVAGDTISSIAAKFGVSTSALVSANGLTLASTIFSGHTLTVPAGSSAAASSPGLTAEMAGNARTIIQVGRSLGVPDYGIVVALATALQESGLRDLPYGDRDSLGLFQQRPSAGWGTPSQLLDTAYSARLFFGGTSNPNKGNTRGLLEIAGWQEMTVTQAAQAVQRSAYPNAYAKWESTARAALANLG